MTEQEFYQLLKRRLAQSSIGPSAIRNQGAGGLVDILRNYLEINVSLEEFIKSLSDENNYNTFLNKHTTTILTHFPQKAQSWGAARKGLNLFLREVIYNKFYSQVFSLPDNFEEFNQFVKFMEVPLDRDVAAGIHADTNQYLPNWKSIKQLTELLSAQYQTQAMIIAKHEKIARVNLDIKYWRAI